MSDRFDDFRESGDFDGDFGEEFDDDGGERYRSHRHGASARTRRLIGILVVVAMVGAFVALLVADDASAPSDPAASELTTEPAWHVFANGSGQT